MVDEVREGDQALPVRNSHQYIQEMVIEDIKERLTVGISRYGTGLQPFNGRDSGRDFYEEILDAVMYAKQVQIETETMRLHWLDAIGRLADARVLLATGADADTILHELEQVLNSDRSVEVPA